MCVLSPREVGRFEGTYDVEIIVNSLGLIS